MSSPDTMAERDMRALLDGIVEQAAGLVVPSGVSFFDAGLTSATLVRAHALLQERLGREIPLWAPFKYPTARALARYLVGAAGTDGRMPVRPEPAHRPVSTPDARRDLRNRIRDRGR